MALLDATAITKSFAGVQALRGVSFSLGSGEVHALLGENGAGKSTLIKVITGAEKPDSGTLTVDGHLVAHNSPAAAGPPRGRLRVSQPPPPQRDSARPLLGHPEHCGKLVKLDAVHLADEHQPGDVALA